MHTWKHASLHTDMCTQALGTYTACACCPQGGEFTPRGWSTRVCAQHLLHQSPFSWCSPESPLAPCTPLQSYLRASRTWLRGGHPDKSHPHDHPRDRLWKRRLGGWEGLWCGRSQNPYTHSYTQGETQLHLHTQKLTSCNGAQLTVVTRIECFLCTQNCFKCFPISH